jgi:hypothetical protein
MLFASAYTHTRARASTTHTHTHTHTHLTPFLNNYITMQGKDAHLSEYTKCVKKNFVIPPINILNVF